jgi:hypothetical protein
MATLRITLLHPTFAKTIAAVYLNLYLICIRYFLLSNIEAVPQTKSTPDEKIEKELTPSSLATTWARDRCSDLSVLVGMPDLTIHSLALCMRS